MLGLAVRVLAAVLQCAAMHYALTLLKNDWKNDADDGSASQESQGEQKSGQCPV